jgi:hypothetical protein
MKMIVIDDAPVRDVKMALAKEHHDRTTVLHLLMQSGSVRVVQDCQPSTISVQIGDEVFTDQREAFPSTQLMARVQLALHAGQACKSQPDPSAGDPYRMMGEALHRQLEQVRMYDTDVWLNPPVWSEAMELAHSNTAQITRDARKITAAVKFRKGLRP